MKEPSNIEILHARQESEASRRHLKESLNELELKVESVMSKLGAPIHLARRHPLVNAALFTILGLFIGSQAPRWVIEK